MHEVERVALTAAFLAAVVVAGLSLSYVPHVELVTLTVFASGLALGARGGTYVGLIGMPLYVFANTAIKGFAPSPLPMLLSQAAGMAIPGFIGGATRRWWFGSAPPRRVALLVLGPIGFLLSALYQIVTNGVFAGLLAEGDAPRLAVFWSGMAFGLLDMIWNAVVFAVGGPIVVEAMREVGTRRGWWRSSGGAVLALMLGTSDAIALPPDSLVVVTKPDSLASAAMPDTVDASMAPAALLRPLAQAPEPVWRTISVEDAALLGVPSIASIDAVQAREALRTTSPGVRPNLDRWGLGWDRVAFSYAGLPLRGPVHGLAEPPDVPLVWPGTWSERFAASGTHIDFSEPPSPGRKTTSQISITSGTRSKRAAEFALARNLGPMDLGVHFEDRFERGWTLFDEMDRSRVWLHLGSVPGERPDWTLDLSGGNDEKRLLDGSELEQDARRIQGSLEGPLLGGGTRLAFQLRRQAVSFKGPSSGTGFGEVRMDGITAQADWAAPVEGLRLWTRWDADRRRGVLETDRTFQGVRGGASWSRSQGAFDLGLDVEAGHQEPFGFLWEAAASASLEGETSALRISASHEEDLPALVVGADRPAPEEGMDRYLGLYEEADRPEQRSAILIEGRTTGSVLDITAGVWTAAVKGYRIESNPLWIAPGTFAPDTPEPDAVIAGVYGALRLDVGGGVYGTGRARVQGRDLAEVPYLARWLADGAVHWRHTWFGSLDLDASVGGLLVGPRESPAAEEYPVDAFGYVLVSGRIGSGVVTFRVENLADSFAASDLRLEDGATPASVAGRTITVGLTFYLED